MKQNAAVPGFFSIVNSPARFRLFLLSKLPAAYFSGVRVVSANPVECSVRIHYKWFNQNPFRSTYFACLSMAAEMSTGVLAMAQVYKRKPAVSMLVTAVEGRFHKKATGRTIFLCKEGEAIARTIKTSIDSGQPQTIRVLSSGYNDSKELVAEFWITWSFKSKVG